MKDNVLFKKKVPSTKEARKKILRELEKEVIKNWHSKTNLNEYEFLLILDEAITNAMEHGNRWNKNKFVDIEVSLGKDALNIKIEDEGLGFNHKNVLKDSLPKGSALTPRGRGIFIIRKLADISWNDIGNIANIKIKLKGGDNNA